MKRIYAVSAAVFILAGCSADPAGPAETAGTPKNQSDELNAYFTLAQTMDEPRPANSVKSGMSSEVNSIPLTALTRAFNGIPKPGDTISAEGSVRIIITSIENTNVGVLVEKEYLDEPAEGEPNKTLTGLGWWKGALSYDLITQKTTLKEISRWGFSGSEKRTLPRGVFIDSLSFEVTYDDPSVESLLPGNSTLWSKLLSSPQGVGVGDTARITVDSLDQAKAVQYGKGSLYSKSLNQLFSYDFELMHRNEEDPSKPYSAPKYNQSKVLFTIPMQSENRTLSALKAEVCFHIDRDGNSTADLYQRSVLLTAEKGDTILYAEGDVSTGEWTVIKKSESYFSAK